MALAACAVCCLGSPARAERLVPWRVMAGLGAHFGRESTLDVRGFAGGVVSEDRSGTGFRRFVALGAVGGFGSASIDDPRGVDGKVSAWRNFVGAELRLGDAWVDEKSTRSVDFYLALTGARVFASRLSQRLPEAGGAFGGRVAVGAAIPRSWHVTDHVFAPKSCDGGICGIGLLLLLVPNTLELDYERAASANRAGLVIGYTL